MGNSAVEPRGVHVVGLEGISGRLRVEISGNVRAVLEVRDGDVAVRPGNGAADAVAAVDSEDTLSEIRRGALNPVVAALQNRLELSGDRAFAIKVILGLHEKFGEGKVES